MTAAKWSLYAGIGGVVCSKSIWWRVALEGLPSRKAGGIEAIADVIMFSWSRSLMVLWSLGMVV